MYKTAVVLSILASIVPSTPARAVEVYRCIVDGGITRYQEQPCSGILIHVGTEPTGVGGLRDGEVNAYLDAVERDVYRIDGPRQREQLDTVTGHLTILRQIVE